MASVISAIKNTVPISLFNRGQAGKIFEDVRKSGAKVVMKNNVAECVLLSPEEYVRLMDAVNLVSWNEMMGELGLSEDDLAGWEDVEIE